MLIVEASNGGFSKLPRSHTQINRCCVRQITELYPFLSKHRTPKERSNLLQIISPEGETMSKIEYLQQQAARAERLARSILDAVTVQRLQAFANECKTQAKALDDLRAKAA
jgi:hypothetical protein